MVKYKYRAKKANGEMVYGEVEADNTMGFYAQLEKDGLFCLHYSEIVEAAAKVETIVELKQEDMVIFCRKLSSMIEAGMSITNILEILINTEENAKHRKLFSFIYSELRAGSSLSQAMRSAGYAFPVLFINMVESGEESGNLGEVTIRMAKYYESQVRLETKIKQATLYPKVLFVLTIGVITILFSFVLPSIFESFEGMELPRITQLMMRISNFFVAYWYLIIIAGVVGYGVYKTLARVDAVVLYVSRMILSIPKVGKLVKKIYSARFASTLAILYSSGLSLISCINFTSNVIGNAHITEKLKDVTQDLTTGNPLSESVEAIDVFDPLLPGMIKVGEETGKLDSVLDSVNEFYEEETNRAVQQLLGIMEPVLLIIMSIVIGAVLISVMVPIFMSYNEISNM